MKCRTVTLLCNTLWRYNLSIFSIVPKISPFLFDFLKEWISVLSPMRWGFYIFSCLVFFGSLIILTIFYYLWLVLFLVQTLVNCHLNLITINNILLSDLQKYSGLVEKYLKLSYVPISVRLIEKQYRIFKHFVDKIIINQLEHWWGFS